MDEFDILLDEHNCDSKSKTSIDGRSRTWMILTYDDNDQFNNIVNSLNELDWNFAGRIHDKEGKPHYHIVVTFKDGRKMKDVAFDLRIDERWLRAWDRKKKAFRYLCHRDDESKYQYSTSEIFGNLADDAIKACNSGDDKSESDTVLNIITLLNDIDGYISYSAFISLCAQKGYWASLRRMGNLACKLLDEHNNSVHR